MKRLFLLATILVCVSGLAVGQPNPGSIGIFTDQLATDCNIIDGSMGLKSVYIIHVGTNGATASMWKLDVDPGVTMQYVGETSPFQTIIGDTQNGISIAYASCLSGQFLVATVNYFAQGTSTACAYMSIVPNPAAPSGNVEIVNCSFQKHELPKGGQAIVNPDGTCQCNVGTQTTSWGSIKSLYR